MSYLRLPSYYNILSQSTWTKTCSILLCSCLARTLIGDFWNAWSFQRTTMHIVNVYYWVHSTVISNSCICWKVSCKRKPRLHYLWQVWRHHGPRRGPGPLAHFLFFEKKAQFVFIKYILNFLGLGPLFQDFSPLHNSPTQKNLKLN